MEGERGGVAEEKQGLLGIKLKRGIWAGKRGGPCTPEPAWKMGFKEQFDKEKASAKIVSARKLGANLWEVQDIPTAKMNRGFRVRQHKDKGFELPDHLTDPSHCPPDQPASASSLRRHVAASLIQHHKWIERNGRAIQPLSPASCSSMEVAAYNQAITPSSSLDFKGRFGESGYSLKTSTELLKVLNRIWSLEEQHTSNVSLIKALKHELDHARVRIQEMMQEQQADRHEIDDLMKQVTEDKLIRKTKEHGKIKAAVQSVREELEDERKLRRRSESLHRKLARELSEVKSAFVKAMKELDRERKARVLLEDLCDEFARGVGDYEQEVRALKQKCGKDLNERDERLILHISEAWLDERVQMKLAEVRHDVAEKNSIVDRLRCEIETFLQAKRFNASMNEPRYPKESMKDNRLRRHSIESIHFNGAISAPQDAEDDDSVASDLNCFELNKNADGDDNGDFRSNERSKSKSHGYKTIEELEETRKSNLTKKKVGSRERIKGRDFSNLQVQFEEQIEIAKSRNGNITQHINKAQGNHAATTSETGDGKSNQIEINVSQKSENGEVQDSCHDRKSRRDGAQLPNNMGNLLRTQLSFSDGVKAQDETDHKEDCGQSSWRSHSVMGSKDNDAGGDGLGLVSPIQKWRHQQMPPDLEIAEGSSKWPQGLKENTLKAKLLEARLEGQHARLKTSRGS